jgi:deoxyribose-phosphate aldolase
MPLPDDLSPRELAPYLDHTVLAPAATLEDVARACAEARDHGFAGVCVRASFVAEVRRRLAGTAVRAIAVVDFPAGEGTTEARVAEARAAVAAGAEELDVVAPLPAILAGRWAAVHEDLRAVVGAVAVPVKVILETGRLDADRKVASAAISAAAGAAFVKTSTGFGFGGATPEDVALLRAVVGRGVGVKASGGVRTAEDARRMLRAGASRVGTSNGVGISTAPH